jgi:hypothetical protein
MKQFIQRHAAHVIGSLSGFDRVRLRGTLRWLSNLRGMASFLRASNVLLKEFTKYAQGITEQIRDRAKNDAAQAGRPCLYLNSSQTSKETLAREIAQRDGVTEGLIVTLAAVEPCYTFSVGPNRAEKKLELRYGSAKCLHHYHYLIDPQLGFLNIRLQTWFPFTMHVCINGREWLSRQMDAAGLRYARRENCFVDLEDVARAQQLMDEQPRVSWTAMMNRLTKQYHPLHGELFRDPPNPYYWSIDESEWATDIMFRSPEALAELYARLIRHGMTALGSSEVMRFLGHRVPTNGGVNGKFQGEVTTDLRTRPEGVRMKHRAGKNSVKMYDKQGSVLRVETTLNDAGPFQSFRYAEPRAARTKRDKPVKRWRRLRKGVCDVRRRAQVSHGANTRYLEALSTASDATPLKKLTDKICQRTALNGRSVRALNPWGTADARLMEAVCRGEFTLQGFRNRDLRAILFDTAASDASERKKQSSAVGRQLRILRAHGLIQKIPKTHRYQLTDSGRTTLVALLHAHQADTLQLVALAA